MFLPNIPSNDDAREEARSKAGDAVKILVVSLDVWRDDKNASNVLSNIFSGVEAEFAQIYCTPGSPSNNLCRRYYQITDAMLISNLFTGRSVGKTLQFADYPKDDTAGQAADKENKAFYGFFRRHRFPIFYAAQELVRKLANWKNDSLKNFIDEFDPDIIFAPCYASHYMLSLDRYVAELTKKPVVSYVFDDVYSLRQFSLSPVFWLNRFLLRRNIRKTFPYYKLTYTMTEAQRQEYQAAFRCNMKILCKGIDVSAIPRKEKVSQPIRMIYAGNIIYGRWKTLSAIAAALQKINQGGVRLVLDIYTANELSERQRALLHDGVNSVVHSVIPLAELKQRYRESDIALHVESFDLKYRLLTRLSFSTKIIDCLASGCAIIAIGWRKQAGYHYLQQQDAAICIDDTSEIYHKLLAIADDPGLIKEYAQKAYDCSVHNHQADAVRAQIAADFKRLIEQQTV